MSELKEVFAELAEHTRPKCASCRVPHACCTAAQCEMTKQIALEEFGVELEYTDHPTLPFMTPSGCAVEPHLRPICSVHVCDQHFGKDEAWEAKYWALRQRAEDALVEDLESHD